MSMGWGDVSRNYRIDKCNFFCPLCDNMVVLYKRRSCLYDGPRSCSLRNVMFTYKAEFLTMCFVLS